MFKPNHTVEFRRVQSGVWCSFCNHSRKGYHALEIQLTGVSVRVCVCDACVRQMGQTIDWEELNAGIPESARIDT